MEGLAAFYLSLSTIKLLYRKGVLERKEVPTLFIEAAEMLARLEVETPAQEQMRQKALTLLEESVSGLW